MEADAAAAVTKLDADEGVHHLDIVVANAGVAYVWPSVAELKVADLLAHFTPNVLGIVYLYQATRALLHKATEPKWVTIGSNAGCIEVSINSQVSMLTSFVLDCAWVDLPTSLRGDYERRIDKSIIIDVREFRAIITLTTNLLPAGTSADSERSIWTNKSGCALVDQAYQRRRRADHCVCNSPWMGSDRHWKSGRQLVRSGRGTTAR